MSFPTRLALLSVLCACSVSFAEDSPPPATSAPAATTGDAAAGPKADDLLRRADDFMGGRDRIDAIQSTYYKSSSSSPAGTVIMTYASQNPGKVYFLSQKEGQPEVDAKMGSDGTTHWVFYPQFGGYRTSDETMMKSFVSQTDVFSLAYNLRKQYGSFGKPEKTTFEGRDAYKVKMRGPSGANAASVFDVETGRILGLIFTQTIGNKAIERRMIFGDWQEVPGSGLKMFRELTMKSGTEVLTTHITDVKINDVDASLFVVPDEVKKLVENPDAPATPMPLPEGLRPPPSNPSKPPTPR